MTKDSGSVVTGMVKNPRSATQYSITVRSEDFNGGGGVYHRHMEDVYLLMLSPHQFPGSSSRTVDMERLDINPKHAPFDTATNPVPSRYWKIRKDLIVVDLRPLADALSRPGPKPAKSGSIWE